MEAYLTRHARNRLRLYEIPAQEVTEALGHPEQVTTAVFGRQHAWKPRAAGGWLRITFKDEGTRRVVITVTPRRQGPGGADAH